MNRKSGKDCVRHTEPLDSSNGGVVRWFCMSHAVLAGFSGHGDSIYNSIPWLKKNNKTHVKFTERMCNVYIVFREIVNFSNTIFFRQHKWMTKLFFNNTTKKVFYLQHWIGFAFGAARLVEFRLVSVGDEMAERDVEMAVCVAGRMRDCV